MDYEPDPEPPCRSCLGWKQRCDKLAAEVARLNLAAQRAASERETAGKWVAVVSDLRAEVKRLKVAKQPNAPTYSPLEWKSPKRTVAETSYGISPPSAWDLFLALWTKAVGTPGYGKEQWKELARLLMPRAQ